MVLEQPGALAWLAGIGVAVILAGCVLAWVVTVHDRSLDEGLFCLAPGPLTAGFEGFCLLVNGHDGRHVNVDGGAFTVQLTACWECSEGLFRHRKADFVTCDACGYGTDLTTALYLVEGERIANYQGWAVIVCPVPSTSVD